MIAQYNLDEWKRLARMLEKNEVVVPYSRPQAGVIIRDLIKEIEALRGIFVLNQSQSQSQSQNLGTKGLSDGELSVIYKLNMALILINQMNGDGVMPKGSIFGYCKDDLERLVGEIRYATYGAIIKEVLEYRHIKDEMGPIIGAAMLVVGAQPRHVLEDAHKLRCVLDKWLIGNTDRA